MTLPSRLNAAAWKCFGSAFRKNERIAAGPFFSRFMQNAYAVIGNRYGRRRDRMFWSLRSHLQLTYARDLDHTKTYCLSRHSANV